MKTVVNKLGTQVTIKGTKLADLIPNEVKAAVKAKEKSNKFAQEFELAIRSRGARARRAAGF